MALEEGYYWVLCTDGKHRVFYYNGDLFYGFDMENYTSNAFLKKVTHRIELEEIIAI
jgi:hypothetical protein